MQCILVQQEERQQQWHLQLSDDCPDAGGLIAGNLLVSTPEGAAALTAAIRSLRQGPVEGAHAAHQALRLRAAQLAVEASSHAVSKYYMAYLNQTIVLLQFLFHNA
jgi:hypothetical protein